MPIQDKPLTTTGPWSAALNTLREWDPQWADACEQMSTNPWSSGVLPRKLVELIGLAMNAACTNLNPEGTRRHIRGALDAGATRDDVAHLRDARGGTLAVPLVVLADLISRGVPPPAASSAVTDLARAGAPDDAYATLRRAVEQDIARGTPGAAAAESRARAMLGTLPPPRLTPPAGATDQTAGHAPTPP